MPYTKVLVDNTTCMRRFHIAYNDSDAPEAKVELSCLHCGAVVFSKQNHPPAKLLRDENLINTTAFSSERVQECKFIKR